MSNGRVHQQQTQTHIRIWMVSLESNLSMWLLGQRIRRDNKSFTSPLPLSLCAYWTDDYLPVHGIEVFVFNALALKISAISETALADVPFMIVHHTKLFHIIPTTNRRKKWQIKWVGFDFLSQSESKAGVTLGFTDWENSHVLHYLFIYLLTHSWGWILIRTRQNLCKL